SSPPIPRATRRTPPPYARSTPRCPTRRSAGAARTSCGACWTCPCCSTRRRGVSAGRRRPGTTYGPSSCSWGVLPAAQARTDEACHQLLRADRLGAQRQGRFVQVGGHVVVVAFEGTRRDAEALGELVELAEGHVADQMRPEPPVRGPEGAVDEDG